MEKKDNTDEEAFTIRLLPQPPAVDNGDSAVTPLFLFSVFVSVCGYFACGSSLGYSSPVEDAVMEELGLSTAEFSLFASLLTIGGVIGCLICGRTADVIGRRGAMGLSNALSLLGWTIIAISQAAWSLDIGRFLTGVSMGLLFYVVPVYIAEITPKNIRGGAVCFSQVMLSCGLAVMFFAGSVISWRILVLIGIVPSLLQLFGIFFIPESPRFLAKLGDRRAPEIVLQCLRGDNIDVSHEAAEIEEFTERLKQIPQVGYLGLFQRKYAHALVVVFGLMALAGLGGPNAVTFYASSIFESAGFSSSIGSIGLAVVQIPGAAIGVYLVDKCGRRPLLMFSAGTMFFCCFLVGLMFFFQSNDWLESVRPYFIALGLWGYSAVYPLGMGSIPYVMMSEIFPMNVKGSAGSLATLVGSGATGVASYTINFVTEWSYSGAFFILAGFNALAVVFIVKWVPETKERTLEEIQDSLSHVLS